MEPDGDGLGPALALARELREAGVPVGTGRLLSLAGGAAVVGPGDLYWAARATLISRREDIPAFDRAFEAAFGVAPPPAPRQEVADRRARIAAPSELSLQAADAREDPDAANMASPVEALRAKDFAECTPEELERLVGSDGVRVVYGPPAGAPSSATG